MTLWHPSSICQHPLLAVSDSLTLPGQWSGATHVVKACENNFGKQKIAVCFFTHINTIQYISMQFNVYSFILCRGKSSISIYAKLLVFEVPRYRPNGLLRGWKPKVLKTSTSPGNPWYISPAWKFDPHWFLALQGLWPETNSSWECNPMPSRILWMTLTDPLPNRKNRLADFHHVDPWKLSSQINIYGGVITHRPKRCFTKLVLWRLSKPAP